MNTTQHEDRIRTLIERNIKFVRYPLLLLLSPILFPYILVNIFAYLYRGAVYVPTKHKTVEKIVELAQVKPDMKAADLGSGDGRIVIALAKAGAEAHGHEINPLLVWLSKRNIRKAGLTGKAFIHHNSYWREDLSAFDIVVVYALPRVVKKLESKLNAELKPDAKVISNIYPFPSWSPAKEEGNILLYEQRG